MPGLIGFTDKHHKYNDSILINMRRLLKYFDSYADDKLFSDKNIYGTRTHLGVINQGEQPYIINNRFFSWMDGEFYNQEELRFKYNVDFTTDNELLAKIYNSTRSFEFLRDINGYYTAALYDKKGSKVYLITDRYGFKLLYWGIINGNLVWSSEVKGFLGHIDFKPVIDRQAVEEFFDFEHLLENRTWFEGIELVPPASILTFDLEKAKVESRHYWFWNEIKPIRGAIDEIELAEELGKLFKQSVQRRVKGNERIGITLSGGLDSRAILAAVPDDYMSLYDLQTYTFGKKDCEDMRIAKKASEIKGAVFHCYYISHENWFEQRAANVWVTDGTLNLLHMHALQSTLSMRKFIDINLNGFAGDLILGGSYLRENNLDKKIDSKIVNDVTKCKMEIRNFKDFYMMDKTDPYFINNRVRRFTNSGTILIAQVIEQRKPFFDNNLIELVYAIPDALRYQSYIYNKLLLKTFPEYYSNIPWQSTGCPISYPRRLVELTKLKNRVINKLKRGFQRFGYNFKDLKGYTDYPAWIRQEPSKSFFEKLLLSKNAIYSEYIDKDKIHSHLMDHMEDKANYHNELCLALTFELWLQQVYEGTYRSSKEDLL